MDFRKLEYFLHIANAQNITHAARRTNISQPALSRQMRLLEDELGVQLFERRARGVLLTEAGRRLQERAAALVRELGNVKDELCAAVDEPFGTVTLAVPPSLRPLLTGRVVTQFRLAWPAVKIRVLEGMSMTMREAVTQGRADLAVISSREPIEPLERAHLLTENLFLVAPPELGLRLTRPVTVRSLADHDLILTPFPNSLRRLVDDALVKQGIVKEPQVEVELVSLMVDLVRQGVGCGVLPYCAVHDLLKEGSVSAAPVTGLQITWVVATARDRPVTVATRKMIEVLRRETSSLVSSGTWKTAMLVGP